MERRCGNCAHCWKNPDVEFALPTCRRYPPTLVPRETPNGVFNDRSWHPALPLGGAGSVPRCGEHRWKIPFYARWFIEVKAATLDAWIQIKKLAKEMK